MSVLTGPAADLNEREPWRVAWPDVGRDETSPWRQPPGGRKPAGPRRRAEGLRFGAAFAGGLLLAACLILAFAVWLSGARNESLQAKGFDRWKVGSLLINDGTISATENWPASTPVALLRIPRYDRSGSVFGGVAKSQLRRGPGYDPTTARPGTVGNTVLIGKSATYGSPFAGLASLEAGDQLILTTAGGTLAYQVTEVRVTDKNDSFAYEATNSERLTLVGHHGNPLSSSRAIVRAQAVAGNVDPDVVGPKIPPSPGEGFAPILVLALAAMIVTAAVTSELVLTSYVSVTAARWIAFPVVVAIAIPLIEQVLLLFPRTW